MNHTKFTTAFKELMDKYTSYRAIWIEKNGNDEAFDKWFTEQIKKVAR